MKVIQVIPNLKLAGAEIMCENLIYGLKKLGHDVTVISLYNNRTAITERLENAGIDIRYLGKKKGLDLSIIGKIKRVLIEKHPDVIHTHLYSAQYAIPAAVLAGVKHRVHTIHSVATNENGKIARRLNSFFFKHCNLIPVALSGNIKQTVIEEYGLPPENIPIVFNGIDLSRCCVKESYSRKGNFKILHIGRFQEVKNHKGLIEAFAIFNEKFPDSELFMIGDGETRGAIETIVKSKNLENVVTFLGPQKNVHKYISQMDIFTLTSFYEGIPMTLIEAMGSGMPIVATNVGGISDMLDDKSALLVSVDVNEIAAAYEKYYKDQKLRGIHGVSALNSANSFSSHEMSKKYVEIYGGMRK